MEKTNCGEVLENNTIAVREIIKCYNSLGIPHFQRGLVWGEYLIALLMESLFYDTPCGSIILWKTNDPMKYGVPLPSIPGKIENSREIKYLIVDGQQRILSLAMVFYDWGLSPDIEENGREDIFQEDDNRNLDKKWCINLTAVNDLKEYLRPFSKDYGLFKRIIDPLKQSDKSPLKYNFIPLTVFFPNGIDTAEGDSIIETELQEYLNLIKFSKTGKKMKSS